MSALRVGHGIGRARKSRRTRLASVLPLALAAGLATAGEAFATGEIACESSDGRVSLYLNVGRLPVLGILSAGVEIDGRTFRTGGGEGATEMTVGQAAYLPDGLVADFTDANVNGILVSVRLVSANEGDEYAMGGVVTLAGEAARVVSCDQG